MIEIKRTITIVACFTILIVLIYGIFSLTLFNTSAKYTNYKELNHYYESKQLYIHSDSLTSNDNKYNIINYYNFDSIPIEISNSITNNQITNYDINYDLKCNILSEENLYTCVIDNSGKNIISNTLISNKICIEDETLSEEECTKENYNYTLKETKNKHSFKIINNNGNASTIKVEIILNTTSPYSKTLKAIYVLNIGNDNNNKISINKINDYGSFCEYTINNNYYVDKNIQLTIDTNKLMFDNTSDIYKNKKSYTTNDNNYIDSITFTISNNEKINLYKKDFSYQCSNNDLNYLIVN